MQLSVLILLQNGLLALFPGLSCYHSVLKANSSSLGHNAPCAPPDLGEDRPLTREVRRFLGQRLIRSTTAVQLFMML